MSAPLFTDEGPQHYSAAFRHNVRFAQPGPYTTKLNPQQENSFRGWVSSNHVKFNPNESVSDYDMRGFWLSQQSGGEPVGREPDGSIGFPDMFKTPYDTTFSKESKYATPDCPFAWHGNQLVDLRSGTLIFDRGGAEGKQTGGKASGLAPGARIWRGAKGFDVGGTPNVPKYGSTTEQEPSIAGGPVSPDEWSAMPAGTKKLAIKMWATNACRAEGVDEKHWVPYLEKVVSFETGGSGVSGTGNPNVVNMYDSNAQNNTPSIGLAQVVQGNAPGQNLLDPVTNLRASIRYVKSTYGDITNIPEAQGIQAGYQTGGQPGARIWHGTKGFDEGGPTAGESSSDAVDTTRMLYHHTSPESAEAIRSTGQFKNIHGDNRDVAFFTTDPESEYAAGFGDGEVAIRVPSELFDDETGEFAGGAGWLDDEFPSGEQHWTIPYNKIKPDWFVSADPGVVEKPSAPSDLNLPNVQEIPTHDALIKEALKGINERGGITIDLKTGHQPSEGYGFAPSKDTELMFEEGMITPEDVDAYIDSHFEALQGEGMHFGAWVSEEDKSVYLDVSKVGEANAETLRAAMEAEQLGIWDFGAPMELGELRIGSIDDATKIYTALGDPAELHAQHQKDIQAFREKASAATEPTPEAKATVDEILDLLGPSPGEPEPVEPEPLSDPIEGVPKGWEKYYDHLTSMADSLESADIWLTPDQLADYREYTHGVDPADLEQYQTVKKVIAEQGIKNPVTLQTDGTNALLVEGNHRWAVADELGIDKIPVRVQHVPEIERNDLERGYPPAPLTDEVKSLIVGDDEKTTEPTTLEETPAKPEPGARVWKDGKSFKVGKDGPGKGGPGAARVPEKASVPELLGKAGKVLGPTLTAANDMFMAYGLVDQAAQQGIQNQVAKGNVVKKGPDVLGIPTGTAFSDPRFKSGQSLTNRSPADLAYWLKHGRWPEQDMPQTRSGPTLPDNPGMQRGGRADSSLKLRNGFRIRHADGTMTHHTLSQVGSKDYRADGKVKLLPGDTIEIDSHRA